MNTKLSPIERYQQWLDGLLTSEETINILISMNNTKAALLADKIRESGLGYVG